MANNKILTIRTPSGLSGDMIVTGLGSLIGINSKLFDEYVGLINVAELVGSYNIIETSVSNISGYRLKFDVPVEHCHRTALMIYDIINSSFMSDNAKKTAINIFKLLAIAEGGVHSMDPYDVTFHEVGALDSIFDICMASILFHEINPDLINCSPLPIGDGEVNCAHGKLMVPAPAVQELLSGVDVYGIKATVETVTPTALAFLKGVNAQFGVWPHITVDRMVRAYGSKLIPDVPNGAIFALGTHVQTSTSNILNI